ncbi:hypothetical protein GCM10011352_01490 [Marinobacterium zhoushanense]|uniref:Uncharacterized protein n=1 Tax=Marinobacterium zhoushanense TaxID=1679163 RepID=A0ABQ1JZI9_9GAMM|nr:hypothetical protein GCM10011352_01490 [Marinobacterium zhoushanense]
MDGTIALMWQPLTQAIHMRIDPPTDQGLEVQQSTEVSQLKGDKSAIAARTN